MTRSTIPVFIFSLLFGFAASILSGSMFLDVWSMSPEKGSLAILGMLVLGAILFFFVLKSALHRLNNSVSKDGLAFLFFWLLAIIGVFIFSLPAVETPIGWRILEIRPQSGNSAVLIKEIKSSSSLVTLQDIQPSSGWQISPQGMQSEAGSQIPVLLKPVGSNPPDYTLLLGKSASDSSTRIRVGWNIQTIDLLQKQAESEIAIPISALPPELWNLLYYGSIWITLCGLLFLLTIFFVPGQVLAPVSNALMRWSSSVFFWIICSFLVWYGISFVRVVFLNTADIMQNGNFLPAIRPIGNDLDLIMNASRSVAAGGSPYAGANKYPPAATVFFLPLSSFDLRIAFQILTAVNYLFFAFITLGLPYFFANRKNLPTFAWFLFATGLFSYGLLFEIERGQFNLIAMGLAFLAIILFHKSKRFRWLAYILFCISVQLKIYPAIFVIFFADDWHDWKKTLTRWVSLGAANFALLFILGPQVMLHYVNSLTRIVSSSGKSDWPVSHSINGFVMFVNNTLNFSDSMFFTFTLILTAVVLILTGLCFFNAYTRGTILDPYLMVTCTLAALLLPTLSNDYTLAYLVGPVIYLFMQLDERFSSGFKAGLRYDLSTSILFGISAFAVTSTYFSYLQKPLLLQNQFPALFILLICTAVLSFKETKNRLPESSNSG